VAGSLWQVGDELWHVIESLLPKHKPAPRGGRHGSMIGWPLGRSYSCCSRDRLAPSSARAGLLAGDRALASAAGASRSAWIRRSRRTTPMPAGPASARPRAVSGLGLGKHQSKRLVSLPAPARGHLHLRRQRKRLPGHDPPSWTPTGHCSPLQSALLRRADRPQRRPDARQQL
jgi:hypothetical protein